MLHAITNTHTYSLLLSQSTNEEWKKKMLTTASWARTKWKLKRMEEKSCEVLVFDFDDCVGMRSGERTDEGGKENEMEIIDANCEEEGEEENVRSPQNCLSCSSRYFLLLLSVCLSHLRLFHSASVSRGRRLNARRRTRVRAKINWLAFDGHTETQAHNFSSTVAINSWRRNSLIKQRHIMSHATCHIQREIQN